MFKYFITILIFIFFSLPSFAQTRIAVLPFEVLTTKEEYKPFGIGTMDSLTNALGNVPEFIMIDRSQLNAVIKEIAFQQSGFTDEKTAIKLGKLLNAEVLIFGSIQVSDNKFRINVRFTEVETNKILKTLQVTGEDIFNLQDQLATKIIEQQKIKISQNQTKEITNITKATKDLTAFEYYINGRTEYLKHEDWETYQKAIDNFDKALNLDKNYILALASKAEAQATLAFEFEKLGQSHNNLLLDAETNAKLVLEKNSKLPEAYRALSVIYNIEEKREESIKNAKIAIELRPNDPEAYFCLWMSRKKLDSDINLIDKVLELNPYFIPAYNALGNKYLEKKEYDKAISYFEKTIKINPKYYVGYNNLGITYQEKGLIDKSIFYLKEGLKINPNSPSFYYNLGNASYKKGLYDDALSYYKKTLELNPKHILAYTNIGFVYYKKGLLDRAIEFYKKVIEIEPNDKEANYNLGVIYQERKDLDNALIYYQKTIDISPDYEVYYDIACVYYDKKNIDDALKFLKKSLELNQSYIPTYKKLAEIYYYNSLLDEAIKYYSQSCQIGDKESCKWLKDNGY